VANYGFHAKNGLFFQRDEDGNVVVRKVESDQLRGERVMFKATLDPNTWASVMASVCARGEGATTFEEAGQFHQQE